MQLHNVDNVTYCRLAFATLALLAATLSHAVPDTISYQGYLTNTLGTPVSGPVNINVRIYDEAGSTLLYEETQPNVSVTAGLFQIAIGAGSPVSGVFGLPLFQGPTAAAEFELQINGETLAPRQPLRSAPYSQAAGNAQSLDGMESDKFVRLDFDGNQTFASGQLAINGQLGVFTNGSYQYFSPRTFTYYISPDRFITNGAPELWVLAGEGLFRYANTTNAVRSYAGFNLPDAAVMTNLTCHFYDPNIIGAITDLWARIQSRAGTLMVTYASLQTDSVFPNSSSSIRTQSAIPVNAGVDSGSPFQINLRWQASNISSALRFYGCAVEYTVTKVSD